MTPPFPHRRSAELGKRIRENCLGEDTIRPSYQRGTPRKLATIALSKANLNIPAAPAVTNVRPSQPAPVREPREEVEAMPVPAAVSPAPFRTQARGTGLWDRILGFFGSGEPTLPGPARQPQDPHGRQNGRTTGRGKGVHAGENQG